MVGGIAQEINARSEVLRIERELEEARGRLTAIRRAKYRGEGDSDAEGYMSGYDSSYETSGYRTNLNGSDAELRLNQTGHVTQESTTQVNIIKIIHIKLFLSKFNYYFKKKKKQLYYRFNC